MSRRGIPAPESPVQPRHASPCPSGSFAASTFAACPCIIAMTCDGMKLRFPWTRDAATTLPGSRAYLGQKKLQKPRGSLLRLSCQSPAPVSYFPTTIFAPSQSNHRAPKFVPHLYIVLTLPTFQHNPPEYWIVYHMSISWISIRASMKSW